MNYNCKMFNSTGPKLEQLEITFQTLTQLKFKLALTLGVLSMHARTFWQLTTSSNAILSFTIFVKHAVLSTYKNVPLTGKNITMVVGCRRYKWAIPYVGL